MPHADRGVTKDSQLTVLPTALAYCYSAAVMRPFLRHRPTFLAILVVKIDGTAGHFESALEVLLQGRPFYGVHRASSAVSIKRVTAGRQSRNQITQTAQGGDRHAVLIFTSEADVPSEYRAAADLYHVVREFAPRHFVGAIYRVCGNIVSEQEASYLKTLSMDRLTAAFRRGRPAFRSLQMLRRSDAGIAEKSVWVTTDQEVPVSIEDLIGYGSARDWGLQLLKDIKQFNEGKLAWRDVDPGLLLSGSTGTGKTRFARALAYSAGLPLIQASVAQWQAAGHLGDMLRVMRESFREAMENAPSILFIDEMDSLGDRTQLQGEHGHYSRQVINGALELMDGALERPGVILVGATNYPDHVDSALLRPGRMDHHVRISLPDEQARLAILKQRLAVEIDEAISQHVVELTDDWTGAQLEQLSRRTRRRARELDREVIAEDILFAMPETVAVSAERLRATAVHEAGHAIVGAAFGLEIERIRVADRYLKEANQVSLGSVHFRRAREARRSLSYYLSETCVLLAGIAAEIEVFGDHEDGAGGADGTDLRLATRLVTMVECSFGMGKTLISEADTEPGLTTLRLRDGELWGRIHGLLNAQMGRAREIIRSNRRAFEDLAEAIVERKKMSGADLALFLCENGHEIKLPDEAMQPQLRGLSK